MSLKMVSADLISCNFKLKNAEKCVYNLELKKYESSEKQQEDGFEYTAILTFDLMSHIRKPLCCSSVRLLWSTKGMKKDASV